MICSHCAAEMPEISAFCPSCGRSVTAEPELTATRFQDAVLGALAYATFVPAIVFLAIPALKSSRFVRFHSWQSVFLAIATVVAGSALRLLFVILSILPLVGFLLAWLSLGVGLLAIVVVWAALVAKAARGQGYELPMIGPLAARLAE
jgi:uncharacterized membrane protein